MARIKIEESDKLVPMTVCVSQNARQIMRDLPVKKRKQVIAKIREQTEMIVAGMASVFQSENNSGIKK